jgi:photosystem II stability/assembly factor-like uncharacterized protein
MKLLALALALPAGILLAQTWQPQPTPSKASLRGICAVDSNVVWASGSAGTYLTTADGGRSWHAGQAPDAASLDFRAVHALDGNRAWLLASGPGEKSRIYKTNDGGLHWRLQLANPDPHGFFDALAFWDPTHGIVLGDPVDGRFVIFTTQDGGEHWSRRPTPPAAPAEGAFAASNTALAVRGTGEVWFATGGRGGARVFHSSDAGAAWTVAATPVRSDGPGAGIFSLAFRDALHGIAVGGDYSKPADDTANIAVTSDGGRSWTAPPGARPKGYRSAAAYIAGRNLWIATGTSGTDLSSDDGQSWQPIDSTAYNALAFLASGAGWAAGPAGRIAAFRLAP